MSVYFEGAGQKDKLNDFEMRRQNVELKNPIRFLFSRKLKIKSDPPRTAKIILRCLPLGILR
jgi:hypothetical protein